MSFLNAFQSWQPWLLLGLIPPAIVLLYFLKLKRQPLQVPSTYLWSRTIEDLHVNSIWQRLRQSLLLFLQLLMLALIFLSLLKPGLQGAKLTDNRFIFLIDNSASMNATDAGSGRTRLDEAKRRVAGMIDQMKGDDVAMLISISDVAKIEQAYTDNHARLKDELKKIQPTHRGSNLIDALRYASGLANPERSSQEFEADGSPSQDVQVAKAKPATLYILSDGGYEAIPDFSIGNLKPIYVPIGETDARNVGITAFTSESNPEMPEKVQAFARLENCGAEEVEVTVSLYNSSEQLIDAVRLSIGAKAAEGVQFDLPNLTERGVLKLVLDHQDELQLDNTAYAAVNPPRPVQVLLVTPSTAAVDALKLALTTEEAQGISEVGFASTSILDTPAYLQQADSGDFDFIIYDRCAPSAMPQANTLFIAARPPLDDWKLGDKQSPPLLVDYDRSHPMLNLLDLGDVDVVEGFPIEPPKGGRRLIESDIGCLLALSPRGGFEDAVLGFAINDHVDGQSVVNTNWIIRRSFPVFIMNTLKHLGGVRSGVAASNVRPGQPAIIRTVKPLPQIEVVAPSGAKSVVTREGQNSFVYSRTEEQGVYRVNEGQGQVQEFAVNLFDSRESDINAADSIEIGHEEFTGQPGVTQTRKELWKWILLGALGVLMFEWYVYNKRVYL